MPNRNLIPSYRLHKPSGLARVILNGKHVYLGPYGSDESRAAYAKLISEHFGSPLASDVEKADDGFPDISINEMLVHYLAYARTYYSEDGKPTKEFTAMQDAVVPLRTLFSHLPARDFGPLRLKSIQTYLVDLGRRCRREINKQVERIRRVFGWAVGEELIPPAVHLALKQVKSLRRGKTTAHEAEKVMPVDDEVVEKTLPFVSPQIAAMVRVQRLSGARPGEIVVMRPMDIDRSRDVWLYRPPSHKNTWRERPRVIALGPGAQAALRPFLSRAPDAYLFSPIESETWRNEQRALYRDPNRKTKIYPCELRARERRKTAAKKRVSKLPKRPRYDVDSYRSGIQYGVVRANRELAKSDPRHQTLPSWFPYQLRHSAGTELRRRYGVEAVPIGLGNCPDLIELYAERDLEKLMKIARETG